MPTLTSTINIDDYLAIAKLTPAFNDGTREYYYWDAAFTSLLNDIATGFAGYEDSGVTIQFNQDKYFFASGININKGINLLGTGPAGIRQSSALVFENIYEPAITVMPTLENNINSSRGAFSIIERIAILGNDTPQKLARIEFPLPLPVKNHGIFMRAVSYIRDCYVQGFYNHGIYINASHEGSDEVDSDQPRGNANHFQISNTYIGACKQSGLYIAAAADTSAGFITNLFAGVNGNWGICDMSSYGCTYISCSCYDNIEGAYYSRGGTNKSLFINCYTEGVQSSEINPPGFILGGNLNYIPADDDDIPLATNNFIFGNPSMIENGIGGFSNLRKGIPLAFAAIGGSENSVALTLKANLNPYTRMQYAVDGNGNPVYIEATKDTNIFASAGQYGEDFAGNQTAPVRLVIDNDGWWKMIATSFIPFAFSTNKAKEGEGKFWLPNGFYMGNTEVKKVVNANIYDIAQQCNDGGELDSGRAKIGDIVLNTYPQPFDGAVIQPTNYAGYICIADPVNPANQTWAGFGRIEMLNPADIKDHNGNNADLSKPVI